jgi:hypothetical protein
MCPLTTIKRVMERRYEMLKSSTVLLTLLTATAVEAQAQAQGNQGEVTAAYAAILGSLPESFEGSTILVDPRMSRAFGKAGSARNPVQVWEDHLGEVTPSPDVLRLVNHISNLQFCSETPTRSSCLTSTEVVHVTFGVPVEITPSTVIIDATIAVRIKGSADAFAIQTWRYKFSRDGLALASKELVASGHGRIQHR